MNCVEYHITVEYILFDIEYSQYQENVFTIFEDFGCCKTINCINICTKYLKGIIIYLCALHKFNKTIYR